MRGRKRKANENEVTQTIEKKSKNNNEAALQVEEIQNISSKSYWLMKSEPESRIQDGVDMKFSFDDLKSSPNETTTWDGVRNYEARKHLNAMKLNQEAFFYHSNCKNPGIIGIMTICREAYPDHTQFDPKDPHYDPKSSEEKPKWIMVDVKYKRALKRFIPLAELKSIYEKQKKEGKGELLNCALFTRTRLSVQSISESEWNFIISLENLKM